MGSLRRSIIALVFLLTVPGLAGWTSHIRIPVKVGQEKVDANRLPFACITIGTAGVAIPIETVTVENLDTHRKLAAHLGQLSNKRRDYPYGGDEKRRALSMAIMELAPGHYQLTEIEFTPEGEGLRSLTCRIPADPLYSFTVKAGCVNFVGSLIISGTWSDVENGRDAGGGEMQARIRTQYDVERTAKRDQRWAAKLIPALAPLPWQESPFGV